MSSAIMLGQRCCIVWILLHIVYVIAAAQGNILEGIFCDTNPSLSCENGNVIHVVEDNEGVGDGCQHKPNDCILTKLRNASIVVRRCEGLSSCNLQVPASFGVLFCSGRLTTYQQVKYTCVPDTSIIDICSVKDIQSSRGLISTPNFTDSIHKYPDGADCSCLLYSNSNIHVQLESMFFDVTFNYPCNDFLEITSEGVTLPPKCGSYYGTINSTYIMLRFSSSSADVNTRGFLLEYKAKDTVTLDCRASSFWPTTHSPPPTTTTQSTTTPTTIATTTPATTIDPREAIPTTTNNNGSNDKIKNDPTPGTADGIVDQQTAIIIVSCVSGSILLLVTICAISMRINKREARRREMQRMLEEGTARSRAGRVRGSQGSITSDSGRGTLENNSEPEKVQKEKNGKGPKQSKNSSNIPRSNSAQNLDSRSSYIESTPGTSRDNDWDRYRRKSEDVQNGTREGIPMTTYNARPKSSSMPYISRNSQYYDQETPQAPPRQYDNNKLPRNGRLFNKRSAPLPPIPGRRQATTHM